MCVMKYLLLHSLCCPPEPGLQFLESVFERDGKGQLVFLSPWIANGEGWVDCLKHPCFSSITSAHAGERTPPIARPFLSLTHCDASWWDHCCFQKERAHSKSLIEQSPEPAFLNWEILTLANYVLFWGES